MKTILERLLNGSPLSEGEVSDVFSSMFAGNLNDVQIAAFLAAWRIHGESAKELSIGSKIMRAHATPVQIEATLRPVADNCGTGGDSSNSFNISTASAIVAASQGAKVAKHGNRSVSSKCGSADLMFAAGYPEQMSAEQAGVLFKKTGFTFFYAPNFHPVMKYVMPVRKSLGLRTIFNLLGPLANPIAPDVQLIGVGDKKYLRPMAEALAALGAKRGMVVHSRDGMDEISPCTATDCIEVVGGRLTETVIDPSTLATTKVSPRDIAGGDADYNFSLLTNLLAGRSPALAHAVALNAGALLYLSGVGKTYAEGFSLALNAINDGTANTFFKDWIAQAKQIAES